ncbi:hypothetical protein HDU76_004518 [Blyttiomyces sp. JEL0837]|nr:hypothetical protein HDU76_004518 [Blyttiomyces sp. JEL0837]
MQSNKLFITAIVASVIGPILIITGAYFLITILTSSREKLIADYTDRVQIWESTTSKTFANSSFTFITPDPGLSPSFATNGSSPWVTNTRLIGSPNEIGYNGVQDDDKSNVPVYAEYLFDGAPVYVTRGYGYQINAVNSRGVKSQFYVGDVWTLASSSLYLSSCRVYGDCEGMNKTSSDYSICEDDYLGSLNGHLCTYPIVLDSICVRVVDGPNGYQLDKNQNISQYSGCYYEDSFYPGKYTPVYKWSLRHSLSPADVQQGRFTLSNGVTNLLRPTDYEITLPPYSSSPNSQYLSSSSASSESVVLNVAVPIGHKGKGGMNSYAESEVFEVHPSDVKVSGDNKVEYRAPSEQVVVVVKRTGEE